MVKKLTEIEVKLRVLENGVSRYLQSNKGEATRWARSLYVQLRLISLWDYFSLSEPQRVRLARCLTVILNLVRPSVKDYLGLWAIYLMSSDKQSEGRVIAGIWLFRSKFFTVRPLQLSKNQTDSQGPSIGASQLRKSFRDLLNQIEDEDLERFVNSSSYDYLIFTSGLVFSGSSAVADYLSEATGVVVHEVEELRGFEDGQRWPSLTGIHKASTDQLREKINTWISFILNLDGDTPARFRWIELDSLSKDQLTSLEGEISSVVSNHRSKCFSDLVRVLLLHDDPERLGKKIVVDNGLLAEQAEVIRELPQARMVATFRRPVDQWLDSFFRDQYGHLSHILGDTKFVMRASRAIRRVLSTSARHSEQVMMVSFEEFVAEEDVRGQVLEFCRVEKEVTWDSRQSLENIFLEPTPGNVRLRSRKINFLARIVFPVKAMEKVSLLQQ